MATRTWDGGAATQNWEDANNWSDNTVPVTGDTAIIPTGMGTIAGTPSADVLAQVTVQGDSALNVTLEATNFSFSGNSTNLGTITGSCVFTDDATNSGTINGNVEFAGAGAGQWNNGATINGDVEISYTGMVNPGGVTDPFGTISGAVSITGSLVIEYNGAGDGFAGYTSGYSVSGSLIFVFLGSGSSNIGTIEANEVTFSGEGSYNGGSITADAVNFSGVGSYNAGPIVATGTVEFSNSCASDGNGYNSSGMITAASVVFSFTGICNPESSTDPFRFSFLAAPVSITGDLEIHYGSSQYFTGIMPSVTIDGSLKFVFSGDYAYNSGVIYATDCVFSGFESYNGGTINANVLFSGHGSYNGGGNTINGEVEFSAECATYAWNSGIINGDTVFSYTGTVYPGYNSDPFGTTGTASVVGSVVLSGDLIVQYQSAGALFTGDMTNFVITGSVQFEFIGSGSANGGVIRADLCYFSTAYNDGFGTIYGDCFFDSGSNNIGYIEGICTFANSSYNYSLLSPGILGECSFESASYNIGNIQGNCTFGDNCEHRAVSAYSTLITGNCVFSGAYSGIGTDGTASAAVESGGVSFEHPTHNVCKYMNADGVSHFAVKHRAALNHMLSDTTYPLFSATPPQPINLPFADILGTGLL